MELRHIRYFMALAEELHFGNAADRMHISQPPLSLSIRNLEEELGAQLFIRTSHHVELTPAGHAFREYARTVLDQIEEARRRIPQVASGAVGRLQIGFIGSAAFGDVLSPILTCFRSQWPGVHLTLQQMSTADQLTAIYKQRLDVGFCRLTSETPLPPGVVAEQVNVEPVVIALASHHPLARNDSVELSQLKDETLVLPARHISPAYYDRILDMCHRAGFSPEDIIQAQHVTTNIILAAAGVGISIVVASMSRVSVPGLTFVKIADEHAEMELHIVYLAEQRSQMVDNILGLLAD